jgi:RHS repeat-associated protein
VVEKNVNGVYSQILYSPLGKTALMSGQTLGSAYIPLPGGATLAQDGGGQKVFWHKDWLGTARFGSFIDRALKLDRAFAPYGEMYATVIGATANPDFTGDTQDVISGLFDTPARELHPTQGRWISPDPAHAGWNPYAYMGNEPLTGTDPTGLDGIWGDVFPICQGLQESGSECDSHYMPTQLTDGYHFGNSNFATFGILPGEQSLNLPVPSLPPIVAAAIGAAITGNWRGLLDSALAPLEADLWNRALNPIMDADDPRLYVSAGKPQPQPCHITDPVLGALEFTFKLGPEIQVGPAKVGFSFYNNLTTGGTGGKAEANSGLFSIQADNPTPAGGSFNGGGPGNMQYSASFLGFQYNFTTGSFGFNPSKSFAVGLQALVGGEVSFNSDTYLKLGATNKTCRAQGGG